MTLRFATLGLRNGKNGRGVGNRFLGFSPHGLLQGPFGLLNGVVIKFQDQGNSRDSCRSYISFYDLALEVCML